MSKQTRLSTEQAIALMEQSDEEDDRGNSEEEEDADDTYLPDPLEIAELEADEGEESLLSESGSENQHTDACSQATTAATQTNTDAQNENEDQQIDDDNTYTNTGDASQSNVSGTDDPQEASHTPATPIAPFGSSSIPIPSWTTTHSPRECQCSGVFPSRDWRHFLSSAGCQDKSVRTTTSTRYIIPLGRHICERDDAFSWNTPGNGSSQASICG